MSDRPISHVGGFDTGLDEGVGLVGGVAECGGSGLVASVDGAELVSVVPDEWVSAVTVATSG